MGAPLRLAGFCVALWLTVMSRAEAQADSNLQVPDGTVRPFPTDGIRRYINGPTDTSIDSRMRFYSRLKDTTLESIGGRVEKDQNGKKWIVNGHSYNVADSTGSRVNTGPINGHTGGMRPMMGEVTREGLHHPYSALQNSDIAEQEQVSGSGGGQSEGESPDSNGTAGNKTPPVPAVAWTREPDRWAYQEGEWLVVSLPNSSFPSLPPPPSPAPASALVVAAVNKAEVARQVTGLANVTLQYLFFLSENQDPDTRPELKVYQEVAGTRTLLQTDTDQGQWYSRSLDVPQAENSSILFEGWLRGDGDVIALSDVAAESVPLNTGKSLDEGDDLTITARQPTTTTTTTAEISQSLAAEGNRTQDVPASDDASIATNIEAQDNSTASDAPHAGTLLDQPLNSTADAPSSLAEGNGAVDNVTETPEASTDTSGNNTQATEEVSGGVDITALNSTTSGDDERTSDSRVSDNFNTTATTDEKDNAGKEASTIISVTDDEATAFEPLSGTEEVTNGSTTLSIPGVTTDGLQANTTTTNTTTTTLTNTNTSVSQPSRTPYLVPTKIEYTNESDDSSDSILGGDELTSGMTPGGPQVNGTSGNITSPFGITVSLESTPLPSAGGNTTETVSPEAVSSTSWQVFQVFLVLCLLGLLALGFLYWKRKQRQDDEIPVFQRGTDYPNPAFCMEDAASFMSRAGRNTYKTIE